MARSGVRLTTAALTTLLGTSFGSVGCDVIDEEILRQAASELKGGSGDKEPARPPEPGRRPPKADGGAERPRPPLDQGFAWREAKFEYPRDAESCDGPQLVRFDERQRLFVGLVLCSPETVRVYLSQKGDGRFLPATDTAGHGQDHCELVNPAFKIGHEDDIKSGGCEGCGTGRNLPLEGVPAFTRAVSGEPFRFVERTPTWSHQVSKLSCGVKLGAQPEASAKPATVNVLCNTQAGYKVTGFSNPTDGGPETHVVGIYETHGEHSYMNHPPGRAVVRVARRAPVRLVLSSYEPTNWEIQLAPWAKLEQVVVVGYHKQTVNTIGQVLTEIHTGQNGDRAPIAYEYPSQRADDLLAFAAERTRSKPASFHGCYQAQAFVIGAEEIPSPPPAPEGPKPPRPIP